MSILGLHLNIPSPNGAKEADLIEFESCWWLFHIENITFDICAVYTIQH